MYLLTLDGPSAGAVLTYAEDTSLREEVYLASLTEASELLPPDNTEAVRTILAMRQRKAELLGFNNYVELSMKQKMATHDKADKLLEDLRKIAYPKAKEDFADLRKFSDKNSGPAELKHWDLGFWSNKQVKAKFDIDPEALRPYFPLDRCLKGLFSLVGQMFGVRVAPASGPTWHKDVQLFALYTKGSDTPTAHFYLDLFTRPHEKRAGAWMNGLADLDVERGRKPLTTIVGNFRPPAGDGEPALLSFDELHTLFHEFGHGLQHMLTTQAEPALAGMGGVEWDAVELSSQFMEYWLDETDWVVKDIAKHYKTGEDIPPEMLRQLKASLRFHPGLGMLGQLHLSILDLDIHTRPLKAGEKPNERDAAVAAARHTRLLKPLPQDRFLNHFSHIFSGGYSAGYYSYKWAEVLSADAFALFEEKNATQRGSPHLADVGALFASTVLAEGGGRKAADVFASFRGRAPSTEALLRYSFGGGAK